MIVVGHNGILNDPVIRVAYMYSVLFDDTLDTVMFVSLFTLM